jgi:hypothetical protein
MRNCRSTLVGEVGSQVVVTVCFGGMAVMIAEQRSRRAPPQIVVEYI